MKKTKIICTIGPASESVKTLTEMVKAGMNVARLNFSHGSYDNHKLLIENIRKVSAKLKIPIAIMQDLQGPKIRITVLVQPVKINPGQQITIGRDFSLDFDVSGSVKPKEHILIEDGLLDLEVTKVDGRLIICKVITGGLVQSHKGVNLPDSKINFPILTKKDIADLQFGLKHDVDFVAMSFVRNKKDITNIKDLIKKYNPSGFEAPKVIAKIEKPEAVENFDEILQAADGIMVARGDLGVEMPDLEVPVIQKNIIRQCLRAAKPVIVATQMMDSMIRNPRPTRAEVSDVANAVTDHADAIMLSGESAFGKYPIETVREMAKIAEFTEKSVFARYPHATFKHRVTSSEQLAETACDMAAASKAKIIAGFVNNIFPARELGHLRPPAFMLMFSSQPKLVRQMCLLWGVMPRLIVNRERVDLLAQTATYAKELAVGKKGDRVVVIGEKGLAGSREIELRTI